MIWIKHLSYFIITFGHFVISIRTLETIWIHSDKVDGLIKKAIKCYSIKGLGISVVEKNTIVYQQTFGYSDFNRKIPYSKSKTKILIASITKSFTAILLNYYSEKKKFDIQAPLNSFLPEEIKVEFMTPFRTKVTSFEDLLAHRMAINRHDFGFIFGGMKSEQLLERLKYIPAMPDYHFRVKFVYTNVMYTVAEKIFEKIMSGSFKDIMKETIFSPLNMTDTILLTNSTDVQQLARSVIVTENLSDEILMTVTNNLAASGIITTLQDMSKWQIFLTDDHYFINFQLLKMAVEKSTIAKIPVDMEVMNFMVLRIEQSTRKQLKIRKFDHYQYAMGWFISNYRGFNIIWHGGSHFGIESILFWIPSLSISIFINVNAEMNLVSNKFQPFIQQMTLIIIDLFLDNTTQISKNNICDLFNISRSEPKRNNPTYSNLEIQYYYDYEIFSLINGKYYHPAFGEVIIRNFTATDSVWMLKQISNFPVIIEYGKLFKAELVRPKSKCKLGSYFTNNKKYERPIYNYYGFYIFKGRPFWFISPTIIPISNDTLTTTQNECNVVIQHNTISRESKLQISLLDIDIIEFVRKECRRNNLSIHIIMINILSLRFFGVF